MYIHVRVRVGARQEKFEQTKDLHFVAEVREKAERNLANRKVAELIAQYYGMSNKAVRIISGHHSPSKLFSIPDRD